MRRPSYHKSTKAIVLLSGGMDSAFNLAAAVNLHREVHSVTFDYGQRALRPEVKAARALSRHYGISHTIVKLPWLQALSPSFIIKGEKDRAGAPQFRDLWVPNRNGVFIAVGAAYAEAEGVDNVVVGFNAEEAAVFPDNSAAFIRAVNKALSFSTLRGVTVKCYSTDMDKTGIVAAGDALGVPWKLVYPCYGLGPRPCGRCPSCRRARAAFRAAGRRDLISTLFGIN